MPSHKRRAVAIPKDSLSWRVSDYLLSNPRELLTRSDVAEKFGVQAAAVDDLLTAAVDAGHIVRQQSPEYGVIWRASDSVRPFPKPFTETLVAVNKAARAARRAATLVDFDSIVIEKGIPIPDPLKRMARWNEIFAKLEVGDSFQVAKAAKDALAHARSKYRATAPTTSFVIRQVDDNHARIWRTA